MNLEQLNLVYLPQEDRILFRIGFGAPDEHSPKQEVKILLTRRLVQRLWPTLIDALLVQIRIDRPEASFASEDLMKMQHQHSVDTFAEEGQFSKSYDAENRTSPLGDAPHLLETISFHLNAEQPFHMQLITINGTSIDIKMPTKMVHGFCKLLQDAVKKAEWQLELTLLDNDALDNDALVSEHRVLN